MTKKIKQILFIFALTFSIGIFSSCATLDEIINDLNKSESTNKNEQKKTTEDETNEQGKRRNNTNDNTNNNEQGKRRR